MKRTRTPHRFTLLLLACSAAARLSASECSIDLPPIIPPEIPGLQQQLAENQRLLEDLNEQADSLDTDINDCNEQLEEVRQEIEDTRRVHRDTDPELLAREQALVAKLDQLQEQQSGLQEQQQQAGQQGQDLSDALADAESRISQPDQPECTVLPVNEIASFVAATTIATLNSRINRLRDTARTPGKPRGGGASNDDTGIASYGRLSGFLLSEYSDLEREETDQGLGYEVDYLVTTAGAEYRFTDSFYAGANITYTDVEAEFDVQGGEVDSDGFTLGLNVAKYTENNWFFGALLTWGSLDFDMERSDGIADYQSDTESDQWSADVVVSWGYSRESWRFTPTLQLFYVTGEVDGFRETSNSPMALVQQVDEQDIENLSMDASLQLDYVMLTDWGVVIPSARVSYLKGFSDAEEISGTILDQQGNPVGDFSSVVDDPDESGIGLMIGVSAQFRYGWSAYVSLETLSGHDYLERDTISVGARYEF